MLTLTRKLGEAIQIGDDITIVLKEIRRNHVRISITAPLEVKIFRGEVYERVKSEANPPDVDTLVSRLIQWCDENIDAAVDWKDGLLVVHFEDKLYVSVDRILKEYGDDSTAFHYIVELIKEGHAACAEQERS